MISAADVLAQLDAAAESFQFPMLDNGYVYPVATRLTAFRDETRWAVFIDVFGVTPRAGGVDAAHNCLHCFGNALTVPPGTTNDSFVYSVEDGPEGPLVDADDEEVVSSDARTVRIRGVTVELPRDLAEYAAAGIPLSAPPAVRLYELMRWIAVDRPDLLVTPDAELLARLVDPLPVFLRCEAWHHPDLSAMETPSSHGCFASLARALESGDPAAFDAGQPNTHWTHWPDGGTL